MKLIHARKNETEAIGTKNYEELSRRHFNRQAAVYDENTGVYYSGPARVSGADALAYLRDVQYKSLLDVGCGTGFLLDGLARRRHAVYKCTLVNDVRPNKQKNKSSEVGISCKSFTAVWPR